MDEADIVGDCTRNAYGSTGSDNCKYSKHRCNLNWMGDLLIPLVVYRLHTDETKDARLIDLVYNACCDAKYAIDCFIFQASPCSYSKVSLHCQLSQPCLLNEHTRVL